MEFPFGHRHHKHHNREEEEEYPPPPPSHHHQPPPNYPPPGIGYPPPPGAGYPPPPYQQPPPPHYNVYQDPQPDRFNPNPMGGGYPQPPPPAYGYGPAPGYPPVQHVSHEYGNPAYEPDRPQYPHELHHEQHHHHGGPGPIPPPSVYHESHQGGSSELLNKPTVRVYSKAEVNYSLTIRDGKVILARSDPSDRFQHWIKDLKYSTKVKDEEGFPSFALVNQATGQALKHSVGATHPVQLTPYNPNVLDESVLWTESKDLGDTYRCIRMVNNIRLNLDALNGDKNHGGVHDGTIAVLWEWKKGDNQRWKIAPY